VFGFNHALFALRKARINFLLELLERIADACHSSARFGTLLFLIDETAVKVTPEIFKALAHLVEPVVFLLESLCKPLTIVKRSLQPSHIKLEVAEAALQALHGLSQHRDVVRHLTDVFVHHFLLTCKGSDIFNDLLKQVH
jgi:hypothetical protein